MRSERLFHASTLYNITTKRRETGGTGIALSEHLVMKWNLQRFRLITAEDGGGARRQTD